MPTWHNLLAVVAIFFVAAALWPWSELNRLVCGIVACLLILVVLLLRVRDHTRQRAGPRRTVADMQSRIEQIRADRDRRFGR
jgi:hypothetical protein